MSFPTRDFQSRYVVQEGQILTRTNDACRDPGRARVSVVGHKAVYKDCTSPDTISCHMHASHGLGRCRELTWSITDSRSYSIERTWECYSFPGKNTFSPQVASSP